MTYLKVSTALVKPVPITGRFLAHNRKSRIERAFLAADLHTGAGVLVDSIISQSAILAGVNRTYAWWAVQRQAERPLSWRRARDRRAAVLAEAAE